MISRIGTSLFHQQGLAAMLLQQAKLAKVQQQMSTGTRLTRAADDPAAASSALNLDQALAELNRHDENAKTLQQRLQAEESALSGVSSVVARIQELAVQVNNGGYSDTERKTISSELHQRYEELIGLANSGDGTGRFLFGGTQDGAAPFVKSGSGVSYQGDQGQRVIPIAPGLNVVDGDPGSEIFQRIPGGNGTFALAAGGGNAGDARVQNATVTDASAWVSDTYTLQFAGGNYTVLDSLSNVVASGAYASGTAIQFNGVSLTVAGTPQNGDSFTVSPSTAQDLFASVQKLIDAVDLPGNTPAINAQRGTAYLSVQQDLGQALAHLSDARGSVGARLSAIDDAATQRSAAQLDVQATLSSLRDVDYTEAVTRMSLLQTALQAAQQTYQRIQGSSLFDFLR